MSKIRAGSTLFFFIVRLGWIQVQSIYKKNFHEVKYFHEVLWQPVTSFFFFNLEEISKLERVKRVFVQGKRSCAPFSGGISWRGSRPGIVVKRRINQEKCPRDKSPRRKLQWGEFQGENCPWGSCPVRIIYRLLSGVKGPEGGQLSWGEVHREQLRRGGWGNCPGRKCPDTIYRLVTLFFPNSTFQRC